MRVYDLSPENELTIKLRDIKALVWTAVFWGNFDFKKYGFSTIFFAWKISHGIHSAYRYKKKAITVGSKMPRNI